MIMVQYDIIIQINLHRPINETIYNRLIHQDNGLVNVEKVRKNSSHIKYKKELELLCRHTVFQFILYVVYTY